MTSTPSVLICDDDANIRRLVGTILKTDAYELSEAIDVPTAIAALDSAPPSLVILDLNIPGGGGLDVVAYVREAAPLADTRVLLVTGDTRAMDPGWGTSVGADAHLTKPFDISTLRATVGELVA